MGTVKNLVRFLGEHKKYWLLPAALFLLAVIALFLLSSGPQATPFVYTLF